MGSLWVGCDIIEDAFSMENQLCSKHSFHYWCILSWGLSPLPFPVWRFGMQQSLLSTNTKFLNTTERGVTTGKPALVCEAE